MATNKGKVKITNKEENDAEMTAESDVSAPKVEPIPELEKPLVSVSISNPFKKILYWLDQIRKRQTTTFAFKLSIPLIALPIIMYASYLIGKGEGLSSIFRWAATPSPSAEVSPSPVTTSKSLEISKAGTLKVAKGASQTRYLLSLRNGTILNLDIPNYIDLTKYADKQVLVSGYQDKDTGFISVSDIAEIEAFNQTEIMQPSPSASLSPSPAATSPSSEATSGAQGQNVSIVL